jgi:hypothetical protein
LFVRAVLRIAIPFSAAISVAHSAEKNEKAK